MTTSKGGWQEDQGCDGGWGGTRFWHPRRGDWWAAADLFDWSWWLHCVVQCLLQLIWGPRKVFSMCMFESSSLIGGCYQILLELCLLFNLLEVPVSLRGWRWFEFLVLGSVPGSTMVPLWFCARSHYELKAGPGVGEPKSWCPGVKQTRPGLLHRSECTNRSALAQPRQQQMVKMSVEICSYTWFKLFYFCNSH